MSFYRDKEIKGYIVFLIFFSMLLLSIGVVFGMQQISNAKALYLAHDEMRLRTHLLILKSVMQVGNY